MRAFDADGQPGATHRFGAPRSLRDYLGGLMRDEGQLVYQRHAEERAEMSALLRAKAEELRARPADAEEIS